MAKRRSRPNISEHLRLELDHLEAPQIEAGRERPSVGENETGVVLVVDDDPDTRAYVRRCLATLKSEIGEIVEASDGREALAIIEDRHVNLVVADIVMPGLDGFELKTRIQANPELSTTPFLLISGNEPDLNSDAEDNTFVLRKPFNSNSLCEAVVEILSNRSSIHHQKPSKEQ